MAADETLGPLPAGRHGFSREQVEHNQRERLIAGLATAVAEHGYAAVTITHITAEAKVSRRVFYANFEGKEECFLAAFEVLAGDVRGLAAAAAGGVAHRPPPRRPRPPPPAVLPSPAPAPPPPRLCLVESQGAGPQVAARFHEAVHEAGPFLEVGRAERERDRPLPDSTEEATIGALVSLAGRKVAAGDTEQLEDLLPDCAGFILSPYLGAEEARRLSGEIRDTGT